MEKKREDGSFKKIKVWGKLMLLGEHAVVFGYPCLAASVSRYLWVKGKVIEGEKDIFSFSGEDSSLVKHSLAFLRRKYRLEKKVYLETRSEIGGYGLGSSAAVVVGTVRLFSQLFHLNLTSEEIFSFSLQIIRSWQKKASGFDVAVCLAGGTIYFHGESKKFEKIAHKPLPLLVAFSGEKAETIKMVEKVYRFYKENQRKGEKIFQAISQLVEEGKRAIVKRNWPLLGKLMTEDQKLLRSLHVSTPRLEKLISLALEHGAYGAKLSGAGGGDCLIALVSPRQEKRVKKAWKSFGAEVLDLKVGGEGNFLGN